MKIMLEVEQLFASNYSLERNVVIVVILKDCRLEADTNFPVEVFIETATNVFTDLKTSKILFN